MAFLGGLLGGSDPYDLYGDLLNDKQRAALRDQQMGQGLLRMAGAFAEAAKPSLLPTGGIGSALGKAAGALAGHEDEGLKSIATAQKLKEMQQEAVWREKLSPLMLEYYQRMNGGAAPAMPPGPSTAGATTPPGPSVAPTAPPAAPGDFGSAGEYGAGQGPPALLPGAPLSGPPTQAERLAWSKTVGPGKSYLPLEDWAAQQRAGAGAAPGGGGPPDQVVRPQTSLGNPYGGFLSLASYGGAPNGGLPFRLAASSSPGGGGGEATSDDPRGLVPYIRQQAIARGIDPDVAVRVAQSEGLGNPVGDGGKSHGAFQLYTGGGMGNEFQRATGLDPSDPRNERATINYALDNVRRTGWTPFHGARGAGIGPRTGIDPGAAWADASSRGERPADIVLPSGGGGGGGQLQALQALMQLTKGPGGIDDGLEYPFPTQGGPARPPNAWDQGFTRDAPKVPFGQAPGDALPGGGVASAASPDIVIPPPRTAASSGLPVRRAQYNPLSGATGPGGGASAAAPTIPGVSGTIPGIGKTPEQIAALNALMKMYGMKSPLSDLLETYYKSPGYLGEVARTEAEQRKLIEKQYDPLLEAEKTRKRMEVEIELKPKLEEAVQRLQSPILKEREQAKADIDRVTKQMEQAGAAALSPHDVTILGPGGVVSTQKLTDLEVAQRQKARADRLAKGDTKLQPGDIVGTPIGAAPAEYQYIMTPEGTLSAVPVPGTPAAEKAAQGARAKEISDRNLVISRDRTVQDVDRVEAMIKTSPVPVTGPLGLLLSHIPGLPPNDARNLIVSLKARASMDAINQARASTGSTGMGQITMGEHAILADAIASLEQSQTTGQLLSALQRYKEAYIDAVHGPGAYSKTLSDTPIIKPPSGGAAGGISKEEFDKLEPGTPYTAPDGSRRIKPKP